MLNFRLTRYGNLWKLWERNRMVMNFREEIFEKLGKSRKKAEIVVHSPLEIYRNSNRDLTRSYENIKILSYCGVVLLKT